MEDLSKNLKLNTEQFYKQSEEQIIEKRINHVKGEKFQIN